MKFSLIPTLQIGRASTQNSTTAGTPANKHSRGGGKGATKASNSIKRVLFGDKNHEMRLAPVDEEREKREYHALLKKKIAERERLRKVCLLI